MIPTIFLSAPSILLPPQERTLNYWLSKIDRLGFGIRRLRRRDYQPDVWGQLQRLITTSDGVLAFGFRQLNAHDGVWRPGTEDESWALPPGHPRGCRSRAASALGRVCQCWPLPIMASLKEYLTPPFGHHLFTA